MNIAIFTDTYLPESNGVAVTVDLQKKILQEHGHRIFVVAPGLKGQKDITFENDILRIPTVSLVFRYSYRMRRKFSKKAYSILRGLSLDVVHSQQEFGMSTFGRNVARKLNVPFIYTFHSVFGEYADYVSSSFNLIRDFNSRVLTRLIRQMCAHADEIIVPSQRGFDLMRENYVDRHINLIPNPVPKEVPGGEENAAEKEAFIEKYHLEGKKVLLYTGRLIAERNLEELISDFATYLDKEGKEKAALVLVGDGPLRKELEGKVREDLKDSYVFVGGVEYENMPFYYSLADVLVSTSTRNTQGLAFLEAAGSDIPILAKFNIDLADLIEDGKTGYYFYDTEGFIKGLDTVFSLSGEERETMLEASKEKLLAYYSDGKYYESLIHVYKKAQRKYF